ncbi:MAG TPA: hypothetical protein VF030_04155, partial [Solirubrobacterales bacterium]
MSRLLRGLLAAVVVALTAISPAGAGASAEDPWQAEPLFDFHWQLPSPPGHPFEGAYRIYDSSSNLVRAETRSLAKLLEPIPIPAAPGVYTVEAWLQNEIGQAGAPAVVTVRFDNTVPPTPKLQVPEGWIRGADAAALEIVPPTGPLPPSGISGYALAIDRGGAGSPCASPTRCGAAEIDLAGSEGGRIDLGTLPEGVNLVRAAAVSGAGVPSASATAELKVDATPPHVSLLGAPAGWSNGPVQVTALARDDLSGMATAGSLGPFTAIAVDGGPASRAFGHSVATWVSGSGAHDVEFFARDAAGNLADGGAGAPLPARATVLIDEDPPQVAFAAAQDPAEPERIEASVSDALSGPSPARGWIGVRPAGTTERFSQLPTRVVA